ncbi:MAG: hypothetical protein A3J55_00585 [Candidatus Ryanbacteria bacterium RIFCSPHIGHO2_02_FULL_45_17b]|uniref:SurA N-terminal domain-containing protein n=1 Tax=Candidatus Ryanbacteria bacterium RIFCSPHIGHO2_01_FULL_45_22 TaxID=1802114 RepID=A0A1G2G0R3_9BACT|nr:MAG: hypothetical protein A2719_03050 [Candidatus Ryanbacteria bacterium RIFCSPHIGHO2_01_FULL_45_22]OGZ47039.1 MAG: hypothetical protein A3J55_00585 [Candidatus Ryanbacteria bacterium RIFCSPHIGHO2_02_FULL_45_17b]
MDPIHILEETQVPPYAKEEVVPGVPLLPAPKRHLVRWAVALVVIIIVLALLYVFRSTFVVALIDGTPISRFAVVRELENQSGAQVLDALVNQTLVEKRATELGIVVSDEDIEGALSDIRASLSSQNMTLEDALKAENVTIEQVRKTIRMQKLAERLLEDQLVVSEEEIKAYTEQNKSFLSPTNSAEEQKKIVRDTLRQQKFSSAFSAWLSATKAEANISYWKTY